MDNGRKEIHTKIIFFDENRVKSDRSREFINNFFEEGKSKNMFFAQFFDGKYYTSIYNRVTYTSNILYSHF